MNFLRAPTSPRGHTKGLPRGSELTLEDARHIFDFIGLQDGTVFSTHCWAGSGMRIGEALAVRLGPLSDEYSTISDDCSTIYIRQAFGAGGASGSRPM
jgi:hypothetical protein